MEWMETERVKRAKLEYIVETLKFTAITALGIHVPLKFIKIALSTNGTNL